MDLGTEYIDQTTQTTNAAGAKVNTFGAPGTFMNITDPQRVIAAVGAGALTYFMKGGASGKSKMMHEALNAVHLAAIPLAEKSIVNFVLLQTKSTSPFRARGRGQIQIRNPSAMGGGSAGGVVY